MKALSIPNPSFAGAMAKTLAVLVVAFVCLTDGGLAAQEATPTPGDNGPVVGADEATQPPRRRRRRGPPQPAPEPPKPAAAEEEVEVKKEPDRWLAVTGATVHTVTAGTLEGATVLIKNGRIHEIGSAIPLPPDTEVIDAAGHHVYPGLVAVDSTRLIGSPTETDVYSFSMRLALAGGITTARTGGSVSKLSYGTLEDHALRSTPFESLSLSNPKARRDLRDALERIREYRRAKERHEEEKKKDPKAKEPDRKWIRGLFATVERLLDGKKTALVRAATARDIREICDLAERYDFGVVVQGAEEGWIVPGELARANAAAIVTPRARRDRDERRNAPNGTSIENARVLHDHGIPLAIFPVGSLFAPGGGVSTSGLAGRDMLNLPLEAAFAVRGGLSEDAAVRGITIDAARILGVDDRVGSLEAGKDADLVITDGPLLYYLTQPRWTIVNGRVAYDRDEAGILSHIRAGGDPDAPPPKDYWPRRLGETDRVDRR